MGVRSNAMLGKVSELAETVHISSDNRIGLLRSVLSHPSVAFHSSKACIALDVIAQNVLSKLKRMREKPIIIQAEATAMGHVARLYSEETGIPYILDLHGLWPAEVEGNPHRGSNRVVRFLNDVEKGAALAASDVIVVSKRMKQHVVENYGVSSNRVTVIPNGGHVDGRRATYSPTPVLIFGGTFMYYERVVDFLDMAALPTVSPCRFFLLGDGPQRRLVRSRLRRIEGGNVTYLGPQPRSIALDIFARAQIGIAPSTTDLARQVAWPVKVMDYMSVGLPVIAPEVGDWSDMIRDQQAGIVTEGSSASEFCDALRYLRDEKTWTLMSSNAVTAVRERYSWDLLLESLEEVYSHYA